MKHEKMWEVFQSARNGSEKYLICEGTPDDFYDREIMYLTATVLQQNLETKLPHLILFHDGTNDLEMKLLDQLRIVSLAYIGTILKNSEESIRNVPMFGILPAFEPECRAKLD